MRRESRWRSLVRVQRRRLRIGLEFDLDKRKDNSSAHSFSLRQQSERSTADAHRNASDAPRTQTAPDFTIILDICFSFV